MGGRVVSGGFAGHESGIGSVRLQPDLGSIGRMSKVVGIDLGTTNSLVACVRNGVPIVIRDKSGDALVPSVVSIAENGTAYVGREAERRLLTDAGRTAYSIKRFMGKGREDV